MRHVPHRKSLAYAWRGRKSFGEAPLRLGAYGWPTPDGQKKSAQVIDLKGNKNNHKFVIKKNDFLKCLVLVQMVQSETRFENKRFLRMPMVAVGKNYTSDGFPTHPRLSTIY